MSNFRYAVRLLLKSPGFALVAILTLALGIGVNSAIFSIVDAVMLAPLPYPEPDRLVSLWEQKIGEGPQSANTSGQHLGSGPAPGRWTVSAANLMDYQTQKNSFVSLAGFAVTGMNVTESGPPDRLSGEQVTANYFSTLGVSPAHGRAFLPDEDRPGANKVLVSSDDLWHSRFGGDPHFLGSTITLDNEKYTVGSAALLHPRCVSGGPAHETRGSWNRRPRTAEARRFARRRARRTRCYFAKPRPAISRRVQEPQDGQRSAGE
jgi:putative ABC transport system permease protein